ncbi:uncharacterized protein LOC125657928 isoform X2 [Ostrea edulis]|uniref:uncharacterized protein LOC125657928 isoform X2 n=1 Tax=Ostrea edulis TaxID=37623 RepID=UPI0024AF872D|nr:uncharacterized protein LOC125657928 isoform X2 [Ostrea edulis]
MYVKTKVDYDVTISGESHAAIRKIQRTDVSETELMIILAEHFFSRLSLSNTYSMDHFAKYKGNLLCKCGSCKPESLAANFDDTSIGNRDCWHGSLDILLGSTESFIHVASVEEELSPGEIAPFEVKLKNVEERRFRSQTLAQVIAFSFLQKASHPSLENFLIPCMAATKKELKIYFYDCKYDILLESRGIPLLVEIPGSNSQPLNFEAIIAAWLVLNYKYLCSGPFDSLLKAPKANFFKHAEPCLEIYEKELLYQHVGEQTTILDYGFLDITKPKFVWPSNLSCKPVDSENEY